MNFLLPRFPEDMVFLRLFTHIQPVNSDFVASFLSKIWPASPRRWMGSHTQSGRLVCHCHWVILFRCLNVTYIKYFTPSMLAQAEKSIAWTCSKCRHGLMSGVALHQSSAETRVVQSFCRMDWGCLDVMFPAFQHLLDWILRHPHAHEYMINVELKLYTHKC